jgi:hypothetical protein
MAPYTPRMSLGAVLNIVHTPKSKEFYPSDDIIHHCQDLAAKIVENQDQLCILLTHHSDVAAKRWANKRNKQRRELLLKVSPDIPECHRPECFNKNGYTELKPSTGIPSMDRILPYINLEDLKVGTNLITLLGARSCHPPYSFAITERLFMPLGHTKD